MKRVDNRVMMPMNELQAKVWLSLVGNIIEDKPLREIWHGWFHPSEFKTDPIGVRNKLWEPFV